MGKTTPPTGLTVLSPQRALAERSKAYGTLSKSFDSQAAQAPELPQQAMQMHAAIEASRRQIIESLGAIKRSVSEMPDDLKEHAVEKGKEFANDMTEKVKTQAQTRATQVKDKSLDWVRANPWKFVGLGAALGFYISLD